jgi:TRAP-type C4-dicarboxylate transport system permease small subunit
MGLMTNEGSNESVGKRTKKQEVAGLVVCIGFVGLFTWLGFSVWKDFMAMEQDGKTLTVDTLTYALYNIGGKWLATSLWPALALFFAFMGFKRFKGFINSKE